MSGAVGSKPCLTRSGRRSRSHSFSRSSSAPSGRISSVPRDRILTCDSASITSRTSHDDTRFTGFRSGILGACCRSGNRRGQIDLTPPGPPPSFDAVMSSETGLTGIARPAMRAALRFPWKLFFILVGVAVFLSAGVVFGGVQWLRADLVGPNGMLAIQPPVKTVVYDARGRVLHEFFNENRSSVPLRQ